MYTDSTKKPRVVEQQIDEDVDLDQWNDPSFRRKTQNRMSQRKHRQNLRRLQEEENSTAAQYTKPNSSKKCNELVWMQPNTISVNKQQKRQKAASTRSTDYARSASEEAPPSEATAPTRCRAAPPSDDSSVSPKTSSPPQSAHHMSVLDLMDSIELSTDQLDDLMSGTSVPQQQSRLPSPNPESPRRDLGDGNGGEGFLCPGPDGGGDIAKLLDSSFDMLLMQYQHGDMFQSEMNMLDQLSSSSTNSFDLQLSGPHSDGTSPPRVDGSFKDTFGCTALHLAVQRNHPSIVKLLLESGMDVRAINDKGETALHLAAYEGHLSITQVLLEHNHPASLRDHRGETVLHAAARGGNLGVVALLLDHLPDLNTQDFRGQTALHIAVMEGHEEVVRLMIGRGINVQAIVGLAAPMIAM